jgi:tRNA threonylcarbamoyladenosine biosynthesis protein TsaE
MVEKKFSVKTLDELDTVVSYLQSVKSVSRVYTFSGQLGAGKTTLIKRFLHAFGVKDTIVSPTFSYVNVYSNQQGEHFYHFDLYRLGSMKNFLDAGFDEYLYQPNSWCLIEWPEIIQPLLTKNICSVVINMQGDARIIQIQV